MLKRLPHAAVACLAGAGLALYAATRVWSVEVTQRPGLSDLRASTTGSQAQPWLIALALIALAGTGALPATRGVVRRALGVLLMVVGAGIAVAAITGRAGLVAGAAGAGAIIWPAAAVVGGGLVMLAGLGAARHGHRWPTMGARYERTPAGPPPPAGETSADAADRSAGTDDQAIESSPVDTRAVWDALDRGDDPTLR